MTKKLYNYDSSGYYINSSIARKNPLESTENKAVYLLPANATFEEPPEPQEDKVVKWDSSKWLEEDKIAPDAEVKLTDDELFEIAKKDKLNEIYFKRQEYQYSNTTYNDQEYLNTVISQNKFFNLKNNTDSDIEWRLADGSWVILDRDQINEFSKIILQKEATSYKEETRLINLVNDVQNIEELKNINWELS